MAGNLALTFLFRDQDLHEIIKFRGGTESGQAAGTTETQVSPPGSERRLSKRGETMTGQG